MLAGSRHSYMEVCLMSKEQFENELNYNRSVKLLQKMLAKGLITQEEYTKIDKLNRISFTPKLAPIMG